MASLAVNQLYKNFGAVEVLKDINLQVETGEFVVLVGPSGCGKSTLLAMIAGLEPISSGTIQIGDRIVNQIPPKDRDIAMVFQSYALYPTMTVRQNITFGMESRGVPKPTQDAAVARVAALLHIEQLLGRKPALLPIPAARAPSGNPGKRVVLGIRPEHLSRADAEKANGRGTVGRLEAPVEVVEPTGAETIVLLRVGSREVVARLDPDTAPAVG